MLERLFALEAFGIKLGLENITRLCAALDHPERSFTSIHVAGTNGKGSVTAMVHAALHAQGLRAARYTSPHLIDINERFVIGDAPVTGPALADAADTVLRCIDRLRADGTLTVLPTFFEATTVLAFELFRRAAVEVAVIEVGLGGRFDATNVITPVATAITTIGFDHQLHLGSTLGAIAFEKAGIVKPRVPLVIGAVVPEARDVIANVAAERGAPVIDAASDVVVTSDVQDGRARVTIRTPGASYGPLRLGLRGEYQVGNALVAVRLLEAAQDAGMPVSRRAIAQGLASVDWPARLERLTLPDGRRVLLDAAHNEDGAIALAEYLRRWHPERPALVVGVMRDKDVRAILRPLLPVTSTAIATAAPTPRAMPAEALARVLEAAGAEVVETIEEPVAAVARALELTRDVCVAGSIFVAGAVRDSLKRRAILQ